jgi:hypothetical protein
MMKGTVTVPAEPTGSIPGSADLIDRLAFTEGRLALNIETHGARLWAAGNCACGASFYLSLPTDTEVHE